MTLRVTAEAPGDWGRLGREWRAAEARADATFFQSWTWLGCLAAERFPKPLLVRAERGDGQVVGLALFNRRLIRLCLGESGRPSLDAPFVEHNAPLITRDAPPGTLAAMLAEAHRAAGWRNLVLSGVPPEVVDAVEAVAWRDQARPAPFVDLDAVRAAGGDYLAGLSANARQQIRRSMRRYAERDGPLRVETARTEVEALTWLAALARLHRASWLRRGRTGAFGAPFFDRFHRALVPEALRRGELELVRVTAGERVLGYLYNVQSGGRVHAYQSGFAPEDDAALKPGLTCHVLAIQRALAGGQRVYDFMAGEQRYKRSLAPAESTLRWVQFAPGGPLGAWLLRLLRLRKLLAARR